jgi:hypothetical protein
VRFAALQVYMASGKGKDGSILGFAGEAPLSRLFSRRAGVKASPSRGSKRSALKRTS